MKWSALCLLPAIWCLAPSPLQGAGLSVLQVEPPRSLDPANHTATYTASVLDPMYEGLVKLRADGRIEPLLATAWTCSDDGREWRFTLRPNVRFHDGTPLTLDAAARSFRRLLSPTRGLAGGSKFRSIVSEVQTEGEDTLIFRLHRPFAFFLVLMALGQADIVSPVVDEKGMLDRHPSGTGPYRFVSRDAHERVMEERNPFYWGSRPAFDTLSWDWSPEPSVLQMALETGEADIVFPLSPVFGRADEQAGTPNVLRQPGAALVLVFLNTRLAPFDDVRVRRALDLATDRQALVAGLLHGLGHVAGSLFIDGAAGPSASPVVRDVGAARRLLVESGHADGVDITMAVQQQFEPVAEALQAMWRDAGVRLHIRQLESGVWTDAAFASPERKRRMGVGAVITSWGAPFNPDMQVRPLLRSDSAAPAGANLGFFRDEVVDRLMDEAAGDMDPARRTAAYAELDARVRAQAPVLPLYVGDDLVGLRKGISGVEVLPGGELHVAGAAP